MNKVPQVVFAPTSLSSKSLGESAANIAPQRDVSADGRDDLLLSICITYWPVMSPSDGGTNGDME